MNSNMGEEARSSEHMGEPADNGLAFAQRSAKPKPDRRNKTSRIGAYAFSTVLFLGSYLLTFLLASLVVNIWISATIALVIAVMCILTIHMTLQWEQAVVLRLGKMNRTVGPGVFLTIPIIEYVTICIDQRMRCTFFSGEQILTADLVPVDVNAVFYWMVWNARKASMEVTGYQYAVSNAAQACMRDVIGSMELEELATRRRQIDNEIRDQIAEITEPWGISVATVKIRDIIVPESLQNALSKAAQAQRERDARVILAEVEKDISLMLVEAANVYDQNERALQLRAMHAVNDGMRENGSMVVVPSSLGDSFGNAADFLKRL